MLDNFKAVYDAELKYYEYSDSLIQTLLSHPEVRAFVYEVCKNLIVPKEVKPDGTREVDGGWMIGSKKGRVGSAINIIFDGPPGPEAGRFVEVETDEGRSISIGEWIERPDGYWALRIDELPE